jgi:protein ImuB
MHWIALLPLEEERVAWSWHALQFTPRVTQAHAEGHAHADTEAGRALLLEISASHRLWGGRRNLLHRLLAPQALTAPRAWAHGSSAWAALALLRLKLRGEPGPGLRDQLPLDTLSAALAHVDVLARTGCRTWGDLRALPRAGVARRFGAELLDALDCAYGERPEEYAWLVLPERFDRKVELPALATSAPELMWTASRLLTQLQVWLQARQRGLLALQLEWTLDLRRLNGVALPPNEQLVVRTAQPSQDMGHMRRLVAEHLARTTLAAPVSDLALRTLETTPWAGANKSLLPEEQVKGERLHELVERLSARLGPESVLVPQAQDDHRPERMQRWQAARDLPASAGGMGAKGRRIKSPAAKPDAKATRHGAPDAAYPPWLLSTPLPLEVHNEKPHYHGPLRLLSREQRVETGWWDAGPDGLALRDYFIARSEEAGLLWIYRERLASPDDEDRRNVQTRWFLQGLYA